MQALQRLVKMIITGEEWSMSEFLHINHKCLFSSRRVLFQVTDLMLLPPVIVKAHCSLLPV